jgi:hypothetical protein
VAKILVIYLDRRSSRLGWDRGDITPVVDRIVISLESHISARFRTCGGRRCIDVLLETAFVLKLEKVNQVNKNLAMAMRTSVRSRDKFRYFVVCLMLRVLPLIFSPSLVVNVA